MAEQIEDGGSSGRKATVSTFNRLNVSAKTQPRIFYASRDEGLAFNAPSDAPGIVAGEYCWYLKNTSTTRNIYVQHIEFHAVEAVKWTVWEVTGTAAGTAVLPSNMNLGSGLPAEALCFGDASVTGLTTVKVMGNHRSQALGEGEMNWTDALILTPGKAIAVEYDIGVTGQCEIDCFFHYEGINAG